MNKLIFKQLHDYTHNYDIILLDIWGVIIEGNERYPGIIDAVNKLIKQVNVLFMTNAPRPRTKIMQNLQRWGVNNITSNMVLTSGDIAIEALQYWRESNTNRIPVIYNLDGDEDDDILTDIKHEKTEDVNKADILLLASIYRDSLEDLDEIDKILKVASSRKDMLIICANPDTIIPVQDSLRYCPGYFAERIEQFGGKVFYAGKPQSSIYNKVFQQYPNINKERILMVGDTFETDILGATNTGIHSALVLSGNAKKLHYMHQMMEDKLNAITQHAQKVGIRPTFVTSLTKV